MPDQKTRNPDPKAPKSPDKDPHHKPVRDTKDDPAPNPDGVNEIPDTTTREEVEKVTRNLKR